MIRILTSLMLPLAIAGCGVPQSEIQGNPELLPPGCQDTGDGTCLVSDPLRYRPGREDTRVWQTVAFNETSRPLGTTDGASIPPGVWPLVGTPYSPEFIRPAILHDHYTWPENRIRPWRDTHRTFLYAMLDEEVDPLRAYFMYYAVYVFGGHWAVLEVPTDCTEFCDAIAGLDGANIDELASLDSDLAEDDLLAVWLIFNDPANGIITNELAQTLANIEGLAAQRHPENFFLQYGEVVPLTTEVAQCLELPGVDSHLPQ